MAARLVTSGVSPRSLVERPALWRLIASSYRTARVLPEAVAEIRRIRRGVPAAGPIRVLHLIETGGPGGAERMLVDLARRLGAGYESTVGLLKPGWLESLITSSKLPCAMVNGASDLGVMLKLLRFVREQRIGLIHAHEFYMNAMAAVISRLTGVPAVVTVHGKNYYPEKFHRRAVYRMVSRHAAGIVTVSNDLRQFFCRTARIPIGRVRVIYNGIDTAALSDLKRDHELRQSARIPATATIVGAVGNLYGVKGHVHLIRAAATVMRSRPEVHVVILGRGELKNALDAEARALGIQDRVRLLGYSDDVSRWLGTMDVFVLPSLSEGLPLSLLEAMAAAKPIVATRVGGVPEVVQDGHTGLLVPPADPDALARSVSFLLDNSAVGACLGVAGRARVREAFSVEKMVAEYRALYAKALGPAV